VRGGGEGAEETGQVPGGGPPWAGPGTASTGWGGRCALAVAAAGGWCGGGQQVQFGGQSGERLAQPLVGDLGRVAVVLPRFQPPVGGGHGGAQHRGVQQVTQEDRKSTRLN